MNFCEKILSSLFFGNQAWFWPQKWENWSEKNTLLYCYELQCSVWGLQSFFKWSCKIPKSYGTWHLSLKSSLKPPFYPWCLTFIPQIVGALGVFLVVHVRVDTYVTRSGPRLHASGANSMQISVKYPETQMSVLACTVSYVHEVETPPREPDCRLIDSNDLTWRYFKLWLVKFWLDWDRF